MCPGGIEYLASYAVTIRLGKIAMRACDADAENPLPDDLPPVTLSARNK